MANQHHIMHPRRGRPRAPPPRPLMVDSRAGLSPLSDEGEQDPVVRTRGTKCELKQLDGRIDEWGNYEVTDSAVPTIGREDYLEAHAEYALVSTRVYDKEGIYQSTELQIKSKLINKALKEVIKYYPGQHFDTATVTLEDPPKPLFHYRTELEDYKNDKADEETKKHLDLLFSVADTLLRPLVDRFKDYTKRGIISFPLIWMLFKPGDVAYTEKDGEPVCFMVNRIETTQRMFQTSWYLTCVGTQYDGDRFGKATERLGIKQFEGTKDVTSLDIFPLNWHPEVNEVKQLLLARGKRFVALQGVHHMQYKGVAHDMATKTEYDSDSEESMKGERVYKPSLITGRIIVDCKTFGRINSGNRIQFKPGPGDRRYRRRRDDSLSSPDAIDVDWVLTPNGKPDADANTDPSHQMELSEEDTLLCPPFVLGFSLQRKRWCRFFIDRVQDVKLNEDAFERLIIPESHKQLVLAMVEAQVAQDGSVDDIIQGKGNSLIMLLHGAPGVGKTLTAESVADHTRRPLYIISSGELGTDPSVVEDRLTNILDIATAWKAVVLLDEADVFLQQRGERDMKRNALVSVFLRILEYYEGILFLTSNRVESFDLAFKSRIHVALHYPELTKSVRRQLWRGFLLRTPESLRALDFDRDLDSLQEETINGRQIKNACKTAAALARKKGEPLQLKHLETTLGTIREFERDFAKSVVVVDSNAGA